MFVSFMVDQKDITEMLAARGFNEMNNEQREKLLSEVENQMIKEVHEQDPSLDLEIKPFYEGNKYYATTYRTFRDLRLVFTIPKSMGKFGGDTRKYVDWLWATSVVMKSGKKIKLTEKALAKDPGYQYAKAVKAVYDKCRSVINSVYEEIEEQERYLCDAKVRYEQELPHYSDANFTMRLSYGQVGGYLLGGEPSGYYTEASSIVRKMEAGEKGTIDFARFRQVHRQDNG